jgi:hypothetical protein
LHAVNYFWVGGSGNWSDLSHWATTSGGSVFHSQIPTAVDDVFFDVNSFSAAGQIVTIDATTALCKNMDWTGVTNTPTLAGPANTLKIYGSLTLSASMNVTYSGYLYFESTSAGMTVNTYDKLFSGHIYFNGIGGRWTLQNDFRTNGYIYLNNGEFNTNNYTVRASCLHSTTTSTRSLILGASDFYVSNINDAWYILNPANFSISCGTSNIYMTNGFIGPRFYGGGKTYNNLYSTGTAGTAQIMDNNNVFNNVSLNQTASSSGNNTFNNLTFVSNGTLNGNNIIHNDLIFYGIGTLNGTNIIENAIFHKNGTITGNNTYNNLTFTAGYSYTLTSGRTQTINNGFHATGNCGGLISISSSVSGSQTSISRSVGSVTIQYALLKDINATGGATFTANNSMDMGNNTGWSFSSLPSLNLYWVGNGGSWSDGNHWSLSSGGPPSGCLPTPADNIFFDSNSFSSASQSVTIDVPVAYCKNMDWTGVTNTPTLAGPANTLKIYGSLTLSASMNVTYSGYLYFESTSAGMTVNTYDKLFSGHIYFNGIGGRWTLQNDFRTNGYIYLNNGEFNTNNYTVRASCLHSTTTSTRSLILGASDFYVSNINDAWYILNPANFSISCGTSNIYMTNGFIGPRFYGGGKTYNNLYSTGTAGTAQIMDNNNVFNNVSLNQTASSSGNNTFNNLTFVSNGTLNGNNIIHNDLIFYGIGTLNGTNIIENAIFHKNGTITGNNTYNNLTFTAGYSYTLTSGRTQTINNGFHATGNCGGLISISSSVSGSQTSISRSVGSVTIQYALLKDINATGGATFTANNSMDMGNNTGWSFSSLPSLNLYWVGNGGSWSDGNHWSLSSGGPPSGCLPTPADNIFFDSNSFSSASQSVTIDVPVAYCKNMDWTGVTNTPTLAGPANTLKIYGSLTLSASMNVTYSGYLYFESTSAGMTVNTYDKLFSGHIYFNGIGGRWTLQNDFRTNGYIYLNNGEFNTNNYTVRASCLHSTTTSTRSLILGASDFYVSNINDAWYILNPANFSISCGTSNIYMTNGFIGPRFYGGGKTYNNLYSTGTAGTAQIMDNNNVFNNVSLNQTASSSGNNTFNNLTFVSNGTLNGNNIIHNDLIFYGIGTLNGTNIIENAIFHKNGTITGNNTYNNLTFTAGYSYLVTSGRTQSILNKWNVQGTCTSNLILHASVVGSPTTFTKTTGTVMGYNIHMRDIHAIGGADFEAYQSVDLGGNAGWNFSTLPAMGTPAAISGITDLCPVLAGITYFIPQTTGAISYLWTVPPGVTITQGQGDTLIIINSDGDISGDITVTAWDGCNYSVPSILTLDDCSLPVQLLHFETFCNLGDSNIVEIHWSTASELNNEWFYIERSADAVNYTICHVIAGAGNSNSVIHYNFKDVFNDYLPENIYYRLRQIDFDGKEYLYEAKSVSCNTRFAQEFTCYPNPLTEELLFVEYYSSIEEEYTFSVYSMQGNCIWESEYFAQKGQNILQIDLSFLVQGNYFIVFSNGTELHKWKFLKP